MACFKIRSVCSSAAMAVFSLLSADSSAASSLSKNLPPALPGYSNELRFSLGPVYGQVTESLLFGERLAGTGTESTLEGIRRTGKHLHEAVVWGNYAEIRDTGGLPALNLNLGLAYAFGYRVTPASRGKFKWYLGPRIAANYSVQFYYFVDDSHGYWLTHYDLAAESWMEYTLNNRVKVLGTVSMPLFGVISRPKYRRNYNSDRPQAGYIVGEIHRNMEFSSLHNYVQLDAKAGVRYDFNPKWSQMLSYHFVFNYTPLPKGRVSLNQAVLLTLHYRF